MKKSILVLILCSSILKGYSQCSTCHEGINYSHINDNHLIGKALPPDSTGGLAKSYILQNVCGLNWTQSSVLVETRSQGAHINTNGTGLPSTVAITFDSCGVDSVIKAFLYFNGSYQTSYAANPASVTITNPVAQVFNYSVDSIGTGPNKCWGEVGTVAYRADVTNSIYGGGNYVINLVGTGLTSWAIDGMTLLIIYKDKSATYSGSIVLYDGLWTGSSTKSQTFSGFNVCKATSTGQAFSILADMQSNASGGHNTETYNGSSQTFPNLFYNFCTVTTPLTTAQSSTTYSVYTNDAGDCYSWVIAGLYWQNNNCVTCTPSVTGTLSITIAPPIDTICSSDSVQLNATGATTYVWGPATGLSCTNCPNPKASPNSTTTYSVTGFNGCSFGKDTVQIVVVPGTTPTITPASPEFCSPDSIQLHVTGGGNYLWKPSATLSCNTCADPYAKPNVTTSYTVYSGTGGCRDSATVTVNVATSPTVSIVPMNPTICIGGSVTLNASGASSYSWTPAASLSCPTCSNPIASPTTTTVYTVVGSNGFCTDIITDTVYAVPSPVPHITSRPDSICGGDSAWLIGGGGGTYKWNTSQTTDSIKVGPLTTKTYTLHVSNGLCSDSTMVTIKVIPLVTATVSALNDTVCPHGATIITATGSGGQATYKWNTGATTSSITVYDTVTTTYTVTVYGICDSSKEMKTVTVIPFAVPVISGAAWKCRGSKDTLNVSSSTNPTTYVWSNGKTTTSITTGDINADSTFYVTAENSLGCSTTDTFHVAVRQYPTATIKYSPQCGTIPDTIKANVLSGTGPFNFQWSTGGTYDTIIVDVPDTTTFTVVVSNGCPITRTVTIIPYFPSLSACCNATINIGSDTNISASGAGITSYRWEPATGLNCDTCANVIATPTVTTTYTVIGTDAEGCPSERVITIVVEITCFNFTVPNVFTPSDAGTLGLDNVLYIKTTNLSAWSILIYDRWGKEMFKSTNPDEYWNGNTEGGGQAPAGIYYYIINGTCQSNTYKKDGFVQLIR